VPLCEADVLARLLVAEYEHQSGALFDALCESRGREAAATRASAT
jgi:hypothetical protein